MNKAAFEKVLKLSEEFFGTQSDPDQMPISEESAYKLHSIHPDTVMYAFDEKGEPIGWAVVIPTSVEVMNKFINKDMTERTLLDVAAQEKKFEALYLCAVFVLPEYRRRGLGTRLFKEGIQKLSGGKPLPLYAWVYSREGEKLLESLNGQLTEKIALRKE